MKRAHNEREGSLPRIMERLFTVEQAEGLIAALEGDLRRALDLKTEYEALDEEARGWLRRVSMAGGSRVDHTEILASRARMAEALARLKVVIDGIQEHGCLVKDLDKGLIDFPAMFRGERVLLCWKLGETGIEFWHGMEEGFGGRKPIDAEFLRTHRGEATH